MTKKRKSGGRSKGKKGREKSVQCSLCGKNVPRDKAKRRTTYKTLVDPTIGKELRKSGTFIPRERSTRYYCVNCAVHRGLTNIRSKEERRVS